MKKNKKIALKDKAKPIIKNKNFVLAKLGNEVLGINKRLGKEIPSDGYVVFSSKSKVNSLGIDKRGKPYIIIDVQPEELEAFVKLMKQNIKDLKKLINKSHRVIPYAMHYFSCGLVK